MLKVSRKTVDWIFNSPAAVRCLSTSAAPKISQPVQKEDNFQSIWDNAKPYESIPGPSFLQLVLGLLPGGKYYKLDMLNMQRKFRDEYGQITKMPGMLGNKEIIMIMDPVDFELAFRNEGVWPVRRGISTFDHYRKQIRPDIFKDMGGLLSEQGEAWAKMRSIVSPILLKPANVHAYIPGVDDIAIEFCDRIKLLRDNNHEMPPNFLYELNKWALETIASVALNQRLNIFDVSKNNANSRASQLIKAVDEFFTLSFQLEMLPSLWRYMATPKYKQLMKTFDTMTESTLYYIDDAIEKLKNDPTAFRQNREPGVFEKLLKIDKHIAVVMSIDMFLAGVDTTSSTMANFMYYIAKNPEKQEKLREELHRLPTDSNGKLTATSFLNAPYLRACIKEVMRMAPIITGTARAASRDIVIKGYKIPKGTDVAMTNMLLHHEEQYFKDAAEFIPERWLKANIPNACPASKASNPFIYLPFGFGPRSCVGKRFAEMEMNVLITRMLKQYRIEYDHEPLQYRYSFVLSPITELKFKLTEI